MDSTELVLTEAVAPPVPLDILKAKVPGKITNESKVTGCSEEKNEQVARDFESILLNRLLDGMKDTIGDWGFEKDGASEQVHGIFWFFLARHIADNGGFGLWKDIYRLMTENAATNAPNDSLNGSV
jgi:Rod binding domain-containing protein